MEITEKVAYLKGLAEGLALDTEKSKEGKLIAAIIDVLDDMALEMADMQDEQCDLEDGLDAVSEDLADVESLVYEELDDEDDEEDVDCYETTCPNCEEAIYFDDSILEEGEIICPNCGEKLEFDLSDLANESKSEGED